jgi:heptaprenyl diphosphate synthase
MTKEEKKRTAHLITLVLLALYFSLMEAIIPKPFPWMKLGLANLSTLIALEKFDGKMGIEVFLLRVFSAGIVLGTLFTPGFLISLVSGSFSTSLMYFLFKKRKYFSIISISAFSAVFHNMIQLIVVYFLFFSGIEIMTKPVLYFVFFFMLMGLTSGIIIGIIAYKVTQDKGGETLEKKIFWNRWDKRGSK